MVIWKFSRANYGWEIANYMFRKSIKMIASLDLFNADEVNVVIEYLCTT